jgi:hypothetical protein
MPAHFQVKVHRADQRPLPHGSIYNLTGANARVNINSRDQSRNTVALPGSNVFAEIRKIVTEQVESESDRANLLGRVELLESADSGACE